MKGQQSIIALTERGTLVAILMCREAHLTDAELVDLCNSASEGQR